MSDPDPTKDQDPTHPEASQDSASDATELTDDQLEKAAGGEIDNDDRQFVPVYVEDTD